ncbi:uncharacterized protein FOMMEDRAFT_28917 [Fomitiporia mediterranea MF3/22]|uniref:uncharacterized protein n=1 Tax=Fomitiporia mediterranea (strain MF3/22) TaxID=694068 RepID=UPI0004407315|nr:uncharacterized protein FOMMEDRAFT_28917 [Fomitiporia mediterranea MF3/22]EJD03434.1 hypothetical protein FOMMEDRAFT_28917 [Fomitiporia mediterranea MF3/22]
MAQKSSSFFGFNRKSTSTSSSKDNSSTGHSWHKGSQGLGKLPKAEYDKLKTELNTHRPGQGYDLYWRKTNDGVEAIVANSAPAGEYQQSQGQGLARVTFNKSDLGNRSNWSVLKSVQQYDEDADWEHNMQRRGSVQNNQPKEMPELDDHGLL